jgi:Flp pilus assembly protein TadD
MNFSRACLGFVGGWLGFTRLISVGHAAPPTFHEQVAPLLFEHCAGCHRPGQSGPFPLLTLAEARKHGREIVEVTGRGFMPPWLPDPVPGGWVGERHLEPAQVQVLADWVAGGMPEGDPARAQPQPTWPGDWAMGKPDLVVRLPEAYVVPAEGRDVYRHFVVPVPGDQVRYVQAWEFRPHSRAAHHAFLRLDRSGEGRRRDALDPAPGFPGMDTPEGIRSPEGQFASWQPGTGVRRNPAGLPWRLDPGTDLVVQVHLQTLGKPEPLQWEVGFQFTDVPPTNQPVKLALVSYAIDLAPGATNVVVTDSVTLPADGDLLGVLPHTHYLGRQIEADATLPDGTTRRLFRIGAWDFNWQGDYTYRQPVFLPAGTRVGMRITFDNSSANPWNPANPPRRVRFGPNTTDEMAELWLQLLPRSPAGLAAFNRLNLGRALQSTVDFNRARLRQERRDGTAWVNLGRALLGQQKRTEAIQAFREAVVVAPDLDDAHYYLGLAHRLANETAEARSALERAVALNPQHTRAHGNLGLLDVEAGRLAEAAAHFEVAVRLDPTDALAHGVLGALRLQEQRWEEARALLERAAALDPTDRDVKNNLQYLRQRGR